MKSIDRETIQKINDSIDIVDVVKDFVRLQKRGANFVGLCPFHNERTPSFSVSRTKGIFKCFSCGKAGSAVTFVMEHESMTYPEALRYLARKYNIEIKEREETEEERQADMLRQGMLNVNEWAMTEFNRNLTQTDEGRNIGLAYFKERGINDLMIERFKLGYSLEQFDELAKAAMKEGFKEEYLVAAGLCKKRENNGKLVDVFRGRVMYPVFGISGKVVAFGGRILNKEKSPAKYINSPESVIYSKSRELYGLYQARRAIDSKKYCILVEGYMDVISMAQAGIENVVASSGTSLTIEQIRLLHRFTNKLILIYDSDAAGIKASLRAVDMILSEGLDVALVTLPDGEDPDSFAQKYSSSEVERYIEENSRDFIRFKTDILMGDAKDDPIKKSEVIREIIRSIASIPDEIKRLVYCQECARLLDISEKTLTRQVAIERRKQAEERAKEQARKDAHESIGLADENPDGKNATEGHEGAEAGPQSGQTRNATDLSSGNPYLHAINTGRGEKGKLSNGIPGISEFEQNLLRYVVRYGAVKVCDAIDSEGNQLPMNVFDFVTMEMENDEIGFNDDVNLKLFNEVTEIMKGWEADRDKELHKLAEKRSRKVAEGEAVIKKEAKSLNDIKIREEKLLEEADKAENDSMRQFTMNYVERFLISSMDADVRSLAIKLATEKHELSKYHSRYAPVPTEVDKLPELLNQSINALKFAILDSRSNQIYKEICRLVKENATDEVLKLMEEKQRIDGFKSRFALLLGERVVKG